MVEWRGPRKGKSQEDCLHNVDGKFRQVRQEDKWRGIRRLRRKWNKRSWRLKPQHLSTYTKSLSARARLGSCRLEKAGKRMARDLDQVNYIKDENGKVVGTRGTHLTETGWMLNEEGNMDIVLGELEHSKSYKDFGYCRCIVSGLSVRWQGEEQPGQTRSWWIFEKT